MKKKLLITIHNLNAGGAQKSLISFLNTTPQNRFDIYLMPFHNIGILQNQVPKHVNIISSPSPVKALTSSITTKIYWKNFSLKNTILKITFIILIAIKSNKNYSYNQNVWNLWKKFVPTLHSNYDIAMSYIDGFSNYFVIDKIKAKHKILWIHNDYNKLPESHLFDLNYFKKANYIITISPTCKKSLNSNFPSILDKFKVLPNISSNELISNMAEERVKDPIFENGKGFKLLSIGRLNHQKGFDKAIDVADALKKQGHTFCWYIIGEGPLKKELLKKINDLNLNNYFYLLGLRSNPYYYLNKADVFIQPSRYEGKSIVLDEAKILCKPIVVCNYSTVYDSIENNKNGIIVEFDTMAIANGISSLLINSKKCIQLSEQLKKENVSNENEITNYLSLIDK